MVMLSLDILFQKKSIRLYRLFFSNDLMSLLGYTENMLLNNYFKIKTKLTVHYVSIRVFEKKNPSHCLRFPCSNSMAERKDTSA